MKKIAKMIFLIFLLTGSIFCLGTFASGITWSCDNGILVVSGTGAMADYSETKAPWYADRGAITTVIVQDGVTTVGNAAFADCVNLSTVTLADSVQSIGADAFANCTALTSVPYAASVRTVGERAFSGCTSLREIIVPGSVESIAGEAFDGCYNAKLLWLGSQVKGIGSDAFSACDALAEIRVNESNAAFSVSDSLLLNQDGTTLYLCPGGKSGDVTVPTDVTVIADAAFACCRHVTGVTLSNVQTVGARAFADCTALTKVTLGSAVTTLGSDAFAGCNILSTITGNSTAYSTVDKILFNSDKTELIYCPKTRTGSYIVPDTVTKVGDKAFAGCSGLTEITLADTLTEIGAFAFSGCDKLSSVYIPAAVVKIGQGAFANCDRLTTFSVANGNTQYAFDGTLYETAGNTVLCVPGGTTGALSLTGKTATDACAFWGCGQLTALNIDAALETFGDESFDNVFFGCTALQVITVAEGNTGYASDDSGLLYNKSKTQILYCPQAIDGECDIPSSVQTVDDRTFAGRANLTVVRFAQDGITSSLGERAFANCTALQEVKINEALTAVGNGVFSGCGNLQLVFFDGGLPTESNNPFYDLNDDVEIVSLEDGEELSTWNGVSADHYQKIIAYYDAKGKMVAVQFITLSSQDETHTQKAGETRKVIYLLPDNTPVVP